MIAANQDLIVVIVGNGRIRDRIADRRRGMKLSAIDLENRIELRKRYLVVRIKLPLNGSFKALPGNKRKNRLASAPQSALRQRSCSACDVIVCPGTRRRKTTCLFRLQLW